LDPLVSSLSANLQRFGTEKVAKTESLQKIIEETTEADGTGGNSNPNCPYHRHGARMIDDQSFAKSHSIMDN
jgi:hypothetical protein